MKAYVLNCEAVQIGRTLFHLPTGERIAMSDLPRKEECIAIVKVEGKSWEDAVKVAEQVYKGELFKN